jgi:hypothetical protein
VLRIHQVSLPLDHGEEDLHRALLDRLGVAAADVISWRVALRSLDARRKGDIRLVYTLDARVAEGTSVRPDPGVAPAEAPAYVPPVPGNESLPHRPVVVGTGPAGLFAALLLARRGYRPLVLERGRPVARRTADVARFVGEGLLDPESNVAFGEGGAGTFSDGKLYTLIRDPRTALVFAELAAAGAPPEILWSHKPHIGTDRLREVVAALRETILALGGEVRFSARVTGLVERNGALEALEVDGLGQVPARAVVLAAGHHAPDTFRILQARGVLLRAKSFSIGLRVEHPQALVDRAQFGPWAGHPRLGAAEYKLSHHLPGGRSAYTFCMCPGGTVVGAATEEGGVVTNGMSEFARDGVNANAALLVPVAPSDYGADDPLAGLDFRRRWEAAAFREGGGGFAAPVQRLADFAAGRPSPRLGTVAATYRPGVRPGDLSRCLPSPVLETLRASLAPLDRKMHGFAHPDAVLTGVESRSSSPVTIVRDAQGESSLRGLYPAGEGGGHAGGIVSAAVDGIRAAEAVIRRFAPTP